MILDVFISCINYLKLGNNTPHWVRFCSHLSNIQQLQSWQDKDMAFSFSCLNVVSTSNWVDLGSSVAVVGRLSKAKWLSAFAGVALTRAHYSSAWQLVQALGPITKIRQELENLLQARKSGKQLHGNFILGLALWGGRGFTIARSLGLSSLGNMISASHR